jgi:hypothetical protein
MFSVSKLGSFDVTFFDVEWYCSFQHELADMLPRLRLLLVRLLELLLLLQLLLLSLLRGGGG